GRSTSTTASWTSKVAVTSFFSALRAERALGAAYWFVRDRTYWRSMAALGCGASPACGEPRGAHTRSATRLRLLYERTIPLRRRRQSVLGIGRSYWASRGDGSDPLPQ